MKINATPPDLRTVATELWPILAWQAGSSDLPQRRSDRSASTSTRTVKALYQCLRSLVKVLVLDPLRFRASIPDTK